MEKDIVSIIKYKWEQNQSIEIGDLMLGDEDQLEKELHRKERALAETAALLVLRKKLNAFWEEKNNADD